MSEPTRTDLYVEKPMEDSPTGAGLYPITDAEFDRIARERGYVRLDERIETLVGMTRLREEWARENPSKALSAALTEMCETCFGTGCYLCSMEETGHFEHDDPCPDCGGTGKKLKGGVLPLLRGGSLTDRICFPASWLEGDDDE